MRALPDRGFTLVEIVVAVAIVATTVAAGVGISLASRSFAVSAAATEFDHLLDSARTIARETAGATLVFAPDAYGDGTEIRLLAPGPNATLIATTMPILHTRSVIEETQSLGKAPFAFVVHASGALGGRPGYHLGDTTASGEVGCPPSGSFHFVIHTAGTSADRFIPCRITLAATGPVALTTWPPASVAPAPTPCSGACTPAALPTPPSNTPSCPPNYSATSGGCVPTVPAGSGPYYHVTASLASPTMTVGGTDSITAQALLTNPSAVPLGTPSSVPVLFQVQTPTICAVTPSGPLPSGSVFPLTAWFPAVCTVTLQGDISGVRNANTDSGTYSIAVIKSADPAPSPPPCDLNANGKCYRRIVETTSSTFFKNVYPDIACGMRNGGDTCWFINSIQAIELGYSYGVQAPTPPVDSAHELLFKIDSIVSVENDCQPYSYIASLPPYSIAWPGSSTGAPVNAPLGLGEPTIYSNTNHVILGWTGFGGLMDVPYTTWDGGTTLSDLFQTVAQRTVGSTYAFTFSSASANGSTFVQWYPDFPGCDAAGDPDTAGSEFGHAAATLLFEVYQAIP